MSGLEARTQTRWPIEGEHKDILRHNVEPIGLITLQSSTSGNELICTMRNLSNRGMMVEMCCVAPEMLADGVCDDQCLVVSAVDQALHHLVQGREVKVLWQNGECAGLIFSEELPLDNDSLGRTLEENRLLAWENWQE